MINDLNQTLLILKDQSKILVTGPQRSGTTIASKILAKRLKLQHFDERMIKVKNQQLFDKIINEENNFVLQCPGMAHHVHHIRNRKDIFIIFMIRDIYDILLSQKRINWGRYENVEKKNYVSEFQIEEDFPISVIKYHVWNQYQKDKVENKIELLYESLKSDDMWVDKKLRKNFQSKQTEIRSFRNKHQEKNKFKRI